jgi:Na+/H+-dicarboxylate symporter
VEPQDAKTIDNIAMILGAICGLFLGIIGTNFFKNLKQQFIAMRIMAT